MSKPKQKFVAIAALIALVVLLLGFIDIRLAAVACVALALVAFGLAVREMLK